MNFCDLFVRAKTGDDEAMEELLNMYKPLLVKHAVIKGVFDEDLYQELCIVFLKCVQMYRM